jgi:hypothetical protein
MHAAILAVALTIGADLQTPSPEDVSPGIVAPSETMAPAGPALPTPRYVLIYDSPYYDCYSRNRGRLECYPGFREVHYRRPYHYRNLFDYPWHEDQHRPEWDAAWSAACCASDAFATDGPVNARGGVAPMAPNGSTATKPPHRAANRTQPTAFVPRPGTITRLDGLRTAR